ncbi:hypothetical protein C8F04DRAFT_1394654 [Mycena alexandri]|uniref:Uncharacterized protein n=1 Tax=Mycena alexandri TaxID=1745969 RepID=A0AAD6T080_9AGAR|nr:hypothetical protein C8F04DRAFT_1394654 [Mycena alexandri]
MDSLSPSRRPSVRGGRPQNAPMGPRTRNLSRNSVVPPEAANVASQSSSPRESVYSAAPRYSGPPASTPSDNKHLSAITEREYPPAPAPEPAIPPPPPPPPIPEVSEADEPLNIKSVPKIAGLTPPPQIKFESVPVKWKGLPLEAALWTFNSKELQNLVSRAIRGSSRESFIRVLSVENLEQSLPEELQRLDMLKSMTQSKYRFTVHRRTMLLQALHSFSGYNDREKDAALVAKLTSQLSQTTADCDQLLEELLKIADQVGQIQHLLDVHWSSALAIALRKLNSSYGRRTSELINARAKITTLQAELNDAWQQAEVLAREMDNMDAEVASDEDEGDAVIEVAEVISLNHRKSPSAASQLSLGLSIGALSRMHSERPQATSVVQSRATSVLSQATERSPVTEESPATTPASPTQTKLPSPSPSEFEALEDIVETPVSASVTSPQSADTPDTADTASIRSARSTRSVRSMRSAKSGRSTRTARSQRNAEVNRVSSVSAARRRSQRASMSSLRMPNTQVRKASHPPMPSLPTSLSPVTPDRRTSTIESFLDFGPGEASESDSEDTGIAAAPRRTSIDEIEVVARTPAVVIQTRDDIHVMPTRSATENELVSLRRSQFSLDHQHPFANEEPVSESIPSIWLMQDTPKTPAERVESMMRSRGPGQAKMGSFQRLKSLTKRYSLPFPVVTRPKQTGRNATAGS